MTHEDDDLDELDLDEDDDSPRSGLAAIVLPFGTALVALAVGALVGGVIVGLMPRKTNLVEVSKDLTNEEIDALCAPKVAEAADDLETATEKVRTLEAQISAKERQVKTLESEMSRRYTKGEELVAQLKSARAELSVLEERLDTAIDEKEELMVLLRKTEVALEDQVIKTELAKDEGLIFKWRSFVGLAQLQICEKGARRKMGRCRETVAAAMDSTVRSGFEACLESGQEIPTLVEAEKGEDLPAFSQWIDQDSRQTRGWYIRLCDPTLPEPDQFQDLDLEETTRQALGDE
ncbi:MAG: hypothetical protein JRI25_00840 [Deltaproteobacteria bacterium]|nr:hypothetical protein [Deltaproteobacteria bacterium]MBW2253124.1 hypothetical protein [Deltaproteobacteria bacterium]